MKFSLALALLLGAAGWVRATDVAGDLLFHFDAAAQGELRRKAGLPALGRLQEVDFLLDSSPQGHVARQPVPDRRPVWISDPDNGASYLRFDGVDDALHFGRVGTRVREMTVFLLAAPRGNKGGFVGPLGAAALGANDYTSGLNFDFGPQPTEQLSVLNMESAGSSGFMDMLSPGFLNATDRPFGEFHVFTLRTRAGSGGAEVFLDGFKGGARDRAESRIALEEATLGARFYSNDPAHSPHAQGHFDGALAEVIAYGRALSDEERTAVEQALLAKCANLNALLRGAKGHALETVPDAPVAQFLVPGFETRELPLLIGNLNNVRYRHDGVLVGQGYDGRIYLLRDTDGDGLEDRADFFWEERTLSAPMGIALTAKDDPRGDGVYVASKGKVSLILDRDRDGRADEEQALAGVWTDSFHGVDTVGLAVDPRDGSIYFGRGCANFVDAYQVDPATGQSRYSLTDERGTIQRLAPDGSSREIICTGVRYTCSLAFNRHGDLFATDQEGATWLPNGNPFDELLHIQRGRHYGFPPRHPRHLPDVVDEPAVFDYAPQHQSTVGMVFNESGPGRNHFGPAHWEGDALVCGESRGKLYRTKLARTPAGYVAQNHLIAAFGMLVVDACVSPDGDLVVACHSGPPDWGTGPAGKGRIFKVRHAAKELPQPVWAWASAPDEFRIAFDRALDPAEWAGAKERTRIEAGEFVSAGDRFEVLRPGYQVVRDQMASIRRWVDVLDLALSEDRRTLVLRVPRQTEPVNYAVTLPLPERWQAKGGIPQHPQMDVALSLQGFEATLESAGKTRSAVLPHASLEAASALTRGSAEHEAFLKAASSRDAKLTLHARVNVSNPYHPPTQPGSKLDWEADKDPYITAPFEVRGASDGVARVVASGPDAGEVFAIVSASGPASAFASEGLILERGPLRATLAPARVQLPWAKPARGTAAAELASGKRTDVRGNAERGREVFFSEAGCATCHQIRGEGTAFGPDLSNLVFRDRETVWKDIVEPSATINPDHAGARVVMEDGMEHLGLVRSQTDEKLVLAMPAGVVWETPRRKVRRVEPLTESLMPAGIEAQLTEEQIEDLLTFLLTE